MVHNNEVKILALGVTQPNFFVKIIGKCIANGHRTASTPGSEGVLRMGAPKIFVGSLLQFSQPLIILGALIIMMCTAVIITIDLIAIVIVDDVIRIDIDGPGCCRFAKMA